MSHAGQPPSSSRWIPVALLGAVAAGLFGAAQGAAPSPAVPAAPAPVGASSASASPPTTATPDPQAAATLAKLVAETWAHQLATDLSMRVREHLQAESLPDLSWAHVEKEAAWGKGLRERLATVDAAGLSHEDALTLLLLRDYAEELITAPQVYWHLFLVTPYDAPFASVN